jgi:hypothetical protein
MSALDALAYIDKTIDNVGGMDITWRNDEVLDMLGDLRQRLTADPDWSDVQEANLRTRLAAAEARADAAVAEAAEEQRNHEAAEAKLRAERDSARRWAVRLEQDLALEQVGVGRRAL